MKNFVVGTPNRSPHHIHAKALETLGRLRIQAYAARRIVNEVSMERTRLNPMIGMLSAAAMGYLPKRWKEAGRFQTYPLFDHWLKKHLKAGDRLITSFAHAVECQKWLNNHDGMCLLDAGNSHPENFWEIVESEHRKWGCSIPPVSKSYHKRCLESASLAQGVIGLSRFVTDSFVVRGMSRDRTFVLPRPIDLSLFYPSTAPRPKDRPLTLICTGGINLRKGSPYLFEAYREILRTHPDARLLVNRSISPNIEPLLEKFSDLPIEWFPKMNHKDLGEHLRSADLFLLPSLEDGLARTATEAMACGLPCILSKNTGAADLITPGVNGEIVPIRDVDAIVKTVNQWAEKILANRPVVDPGPTIRALSYDTFLENWKDMIKAIDTW